jgi:hypothetical protein
MTTDITAEHIIDVHRLNYRLGVFVTAGLNNMGLKREASIDLLMATIALNSMNQVDALSRFSGLAKRSKRVDSDQKSTAAHAYELYAKFVSAHHMDSVSQYRPASIGELPDSEMNDIVASLGVSYPEVPSLYVNDDVTGAWGIACRNSYRAYQRLGALFYLMSQLPKHLSGVERDRVVPEADAAMTVLFRGAAAFEMSEMKLAVLLGGNALERTRSKIIAKSFGPGVSIIQYLQDDEHLPGRYSSVTEQGFRDKIAEYAQAV